MCFDKVYRGRNIKICSSNGKEYRKTLSILVNDEVVSAPRNLIFMMSIVLI